MQNSGVAWKLLGWGLGVFQQCKLEAVLISNECDSLLRGDDIAYISQGEEIEIGLLLTPNNSDASIFEDFQQYHDRLQLTVEFTNENGTVLGRIVPISVNSIDAHIDCPIEGKIIEGETRKYYLFKRTSFQILEGLCDAQCHMVITLSVDVNNQKHKGFAVRSRSADLSNINLVNSITTGTVNDHNPGAAAGGPHDDETAVRALLDAHRFQPPKIPPRQVTLPVRFITPIRTNSWSRLSIRSEDSLPMCLVHIAVSNRHPHRSIQVADARLCLQHSHVHSLSTGDGGSTITLSGTAMDASILFTSELLLPFAVYHSEHCDDPTASDCELDPVILQPGESYTFSFRVSPRLDMLGSSSAQLLTSTELFELNSPIIFSYFHCSGVDDVAAEPCRQHTITSQVCSTQQHHQQAKLKLLRLESSAQWYMVGSQLHRPSHKLNSTLSFPLNSIAPPRMVAATRTPLAITITRDPLCPVKSLHSISLHVVIHNHSNVDYNVVLCTSPVNCTGVNVVDELQQKQHVLSKECFSDQCVQALPDPIIWQQEYVVLRNILPHTSVITNLQMISLQATGVVTVSSLRLFDLDTKQLLVIMDPIQLLME